MKAKENKIQEVKETNKTSFPNGKKEEIYCEMVHCTRKANWYEQSSDMYLCNECFKNIGGTAIKIRI